MIAYPRQVSPGRTLFPACQVTVRQNTAPIETGYPEQ
jgi:hypothetical protein